eukprot:8794316-Pyramimonas_sp.AAC.1
MCPNPAHGTAWEAPYCVLRWKARVPQGAQGVTCRYGCEHQAPSTRALTCQHIAPEAMLVTAWHSLYPQLFSGLEAARHVHPQLPVDSSPAQLDDWLQRSGLPPGSFTNLPPLCKSQPSR